MPQASRFPSGMQAKEGSPSCADIKCDFSSLEPPVLDFVKELSAFLKGQDVWDLQAKSGKSVFFLPSFPSFPREIRSSKKCLGKCLGVPDILLPDIRDKIGKASAKDIGKRGGSFHSQGTENLHITDIVP